MPPKKKDKHDCSICMLSQSAGRCLALKKQINNCWAYCGTVEELVERYTSVASTLSSEDKVKEARSEMMKQIRNKGYDVQRVRFPF